MQPSKSPLQTRRTGTPQLAEGGDHMEDHRAATGVRAAEAGTQPWRQPAREGEPEAHLLEDLNPANNAGKHSSRFCPRTSNRSHSPADISNLAWGGPSHISDLYEKSKCCFDPLNF